MITVRLFGMLKNLTGTNGTLGLDLPAGCSVKDLTAYLQRAYPELGELVAKKKVLISVNQNIAQDETTIHETDEIALLPPFAGGCSRTCRGA